MFFLNEAKSRDYFDMPSISLSSLVWKLRFFKYVNIYFPELNQKPNKLPNLTLHRLYSSSGFHQRLILLGK